MDCPFMAAFLARLLPDVRRGSISAVYNDALPKLKGRAVAPGSTPTRASWACRAALGILINPWLPPAPPAVRHESSSKVLREEQIQEIIARVLTPLMRPLVVRITEARMLDVRDHLLAKLHEDERELGQMERVERLLRTALGDPCAAGDHFYDFLYRTYQSVETLVPWAESLLEVS